MWWLVWADSTVCVLAYFVTYNATTAAFVPQPPNVVCKTRVWHPNIALQGGGVCLR